MLDKTSLGPIMGQPNYVVIILHERATPIVPLSTNVIE